MNRYKYNYYYLIDDDIYGFIDISIQESFLVLLVEQTRKGNISGALLAIRTFFN